MTRTEQIDKLLSKWQQDLSAAQSNLLALYDYPTYRRIEAQSGNNTTTLTGETASRVNPALAALTDLFNQMGLLQDILDRAFKIRKSVSLFGNAEHLHKIVDLLTGQSIVLPPIQTPLAQRGLLSAAEVSQSTTPPRLLNAMQKAFDDAKTAIIELDTIWTRVDTELASAQDKLISIKNQAKASGMDEYAELKAAADLLVKLQNQAKTDPYGADRVYANNVTAAIDRAKAVFTQRQREYEAISTALSNAHNLLNHITDLKSKYRTAIPQLTVDLSGIPPSLTDQQISELTTWLASLEDTVRSGSIKAVQVGLDRWNELAIKYRTIQEEATNEVTTAFERVADLQGRFSALQVKASAKNFISDAELMRIAQTVDKLFASDIVNLKAIALLVSQYEQRISALQTR